MPVVLAPGPVLTIFPFVGKIPIMVSNNHCRSALHCSITVLCNIVIKILTISDIPEKETLSLSRGGVKKSGVSFSKKFFIWMIFMPFL